MVFDFPYGQNYFEILWSLLNFVVNSNAMIVYNVMRFQSIIAYFIVLTFLVKIPPQQQLAFDRYSPIQ